MDLVETISAWNWDTLLAIALQVCGAFALVATMTANRSDNAIADALLRLVNFLGANFGRSRNAPE